MADLSACVAIVLLVVAELQYPGWDAIPSWKKFGVAAIFVSVIAVLQYLSSILNLLRNRRG